MKKILLIMLVLILSASYFLSKNASPISNKLIKSDETKNIINMEKLENKQNEKLKAVEIDGQYPYDISKIKELGFNLVILSQNGVRNFNAPYKTDYNSLRQMEKNIKNIESCEMEYIISIKSGPGFSFDGKISSIFSNDTQAFYFSKMAGEIIKRHVKSRYFKGIMIDIENTNITEENYYNTLSFIAENIQKNFSDVKIIYNLYPCSFENGFKNLPEPKLKNVSLNAVISLKGISYPGYGTAYKSSVRLLKNELLSSLQNLKEFKDKNSYDLILTVKIPWAEKSDVFLQDIYEINKMLSFNLNLFSINSNDDYDFSKNEYVLNVIQRNNK